MSRQLRDRDVRRCGWCGDWVIIGRPCIACGIRLQAECSEGTRQMLAERAILQEADRIRERRELLESL